MREQFLKLSAQFQVLKLRPSTDETEEKLQINRLLQGWNDMSFRGSSHIYTPNIDALAASGFILNNYYTHGLCSPSRGALMSGKYANRLGLYKDLKPAQPFGLPLNVSTLPEYLKQLGYKTHMIGKWHLGYHRKSYLPTRRGFDTFFGFVNDYIDCYDYTTFYMDDSQNSEVKRVFGVDLWENEEVVMNFRGEYATEVFTQKAIEVIQAHNISKPLFLYLSHAACHTGNSFYPLQVPIEYVERNSHIEDINRRNYAGVVSALDDSLGKIFRSLREKNMLSNTLIVFSSDSGASDGLASNWPLRGQKSFAWEGGTRSTAVVWSPLFELERPKILRHLMHITDWLPTLYHAAGGHITELEDVDGVNMWPTFFSSNSHGYRYEIFHLFDHTLQAGSILVGDMKLIFGSYNERGGDWYSQAEENENYTDNLLDRRLFQDSDYIKDILIDDGIWLQTENDTWPQDTALLCGENFFPVSGKCDFSEGPCLYNITNDPCEYKNIAKVYPEIVQSLMERIEYLNFSSVSLPESEVDEHGDPLCFNFAYIPWLEEDSSSQCT